MQEHLSLPDVLREEYETIHGDLRDGVDDLPALLAEMHKKEQTALCLSGGGIRSATFALGVIQSLAQRGLLSQFHYLSTVSGGGYIGAWLSAYARRRGGIDAVVKEMKAPRASPLSPEIEPIKHLRQFSNYLTPKLGLLSADTWTLVGTYLRNVSLTWLVLVPLFVAVLALPRLFVSVLRWAPPLWAMYATAAVAIVTYFLALWYLCGSRPVGARPRFWSKRDADAQPYLTNDKFVTRGVVPLLLCAMATALAYGWCHHHPPKMAMSEIAAIAGGFAVIISLILVVAYMWRFKKAAEEGEDLGSRRRGVKRNVYMFKKWFAESVAAALSGIVGAAVAWGALTSSVFSPPFPPLAQPGMEDWLDLAAVFPSARIALYVCFAVPVMLGALAIQATIFIAAASWFNEEYDREWWARAGAWCAIAALGWIAVTVIALYGPVFIYYAPRTVAGIGMITGGFAVLMGRSAKTAANRKQKEEEGLLGKGLNISLGIAVPIFALCLLCGLSLATTKLLEPLVAAPAMSVEDRNLLERTSWTYETKKAGPRLPLKGGERTMKTIEMPAMEGDTFAAREHLHVVDRTTVSEAYLVFAVGAIVSAIAALFVGVNRFSMNALYRNRLIRGYLGASRIGRDPNPFTGFDPDDNLQLDSLLPDYVMAEDLLEPNAILEMLQKPRTLWLDDFAKIITRLESLEPGPFLAERLARRLREVIFTYDLIRQPFATVEEPFRTPRQRARNRKIIEATLNAQCPRQCPVMRAAPKAPFHVVNMALNLVGGAELAWSERMAQSFTASPLHCGSHSEENRLGYRNTSEYGGSSGMSLGMAVSISGAAASPNMGYHSSPALAFLLTFFNVRLGAWLGNPGAAGRHTFGLQNPRWSLYPLISEAAGATDARHPYVYLSDGGHFENLGLYEMVRRRCRSIVVCDAGEDPHFSFEDLGNAIRKIRIDFGIPITIERMGLYPRPKEPDGKLPDNPKYCALGTIHYGEVDRGASYETADHRAPNGQFIYIKPVFYGEREPKDVFNYAKTNPAFPHESTLGDQFFSESQFESYRILGHHILEEICPKQTPTVAAFVSAADEYVKRDDRGSAVKRFVDRILT